MNVIKRWFMLYDSVKRSYKLVFPDGSEYAPGDSILLWRKYYSAWLEAKIETVDSLFVLMHVTYPNGVYVEMMPPATFAQDVKNGLVKRAEKCYDVGVPGGSSVSKL